MHRKWLIISMLLIAAVFVVVGFIGMVTDNKKGFTETAPKVKIEGPTQSNAEVPMTLPIPPLLTDENADPTTADFYLSVQKGSSSFIEGKMTPTLGYNGDYLGPVIQVTNGESVNVHVENTLEVTTSVHWHGLVVAGDEDGGPHQKIQAGDLWEPSFVIDQPASTLWFHPHVIGTTATQVYQGLAGLIIIEDENSQSLNLPDDYGINDIPLIIQDRSFNDDGTFVYDSNMMNGVVGDYLLVNGAIAPTLTVDQVKMRFRIVNGANARNLGLVLTDEAEFYQIASDGGLLERPIKMKGLFLAPSERGEIIIDFSKYEEGDQVDLVSGDDYVMSFRVGKEAQDLTVIPDELATIEPIDPSTATGIKTVELNGMGHMVSLNGKKFDMNRIDDNVTLGVTEIWEITTNSSMMGRMGHPFHIHGTQFQVLSRDGKEPYENEKGWKDTVFVGPDETVRIIVRFKYEGVYMYHCHILEHEEAGMMGQLEVSK